MLIKRASDIRYSEVTPKDVYFNRRKFLAAMPLAFLGAREFLSPSAMSAAPLANVRKSPLSTTEKANTYKEVTNYNNYYEFGTNKEGVADQVKKFQMPAQWVVSVEGEVAKPRKISIDDIMKLAPLEERIYRHRCVEGWSIVVPWIGYSLSELLNQVQPTSKAKFVAFESYWDQRKQPLARPELAGIDLPYVEGLRLDEAMHPLTMLTVGMFGETLPMQDGAPVRLTVPWKYGFKSIKSLVKVKLVGSMPPTTWNIANSREYGFYSNVNPQVDHPRWSQASERRLGELRRRPTLMFNGYGDQVSSLYAGMDLKKFY
ncbi:MAG TPA: protein-methionine-sulfoxide reductase catalytic subunit MsrP, partial [Candidatus Solibacter sp.]|nr:protein-methionine-sulfoxide reductase catalytic subunit MsrP [Candidatus Solibacter sp.]